jgi:hypothetical protein
MLESDLRKRKELYRAHDPDEEAIWPRFGFGRHIVRASPCDGNNTIPQETSIMAMLSFLKSTNLKLR